MIMMIFLVAWKIMVIFIVNHILLRYHMVLMVRRYKKLKLRKKWVTEISLEINIYRLKNNIKIQEMVLRSKLNKKLLMIRRLGLLERKSRANKKYIEN